MPNHIKQFWPYGLAALGATLFASKGIFIKLAYGYPIDATSLMFLRLCFATPFFVIVAILTIIWSQKTLQNEPQSQQNPVAARSILPAMAIGALGYWAASFTDFMSLKYLSVQLERLILFTYPAFVVILGILFQGQKPKPWPLAALGLSYGGLMIVFATDLQLQGNQIVVGAIWGLVSSLCFSGYLILAKPLVKQIGTSYFTSLAMVGAFIIMTVHFALTHDLTNFHPPNEVLWLSLGLAIGATVLPVYLMNLALSKLTSQANAMIGFLNPVITVILGVMILNEQITLPHFFGTITVLLGVGLYSYLDARNPQTSV